MPFDMSSAWTENDLRNLVRNADGTYSPGAGLPKEFRVHDAAVVTSPSKPPVYLSEIGGLGLRKLTLILMGEPMPKQSVRSFVTKGAKPTVGHYQPTEMKDRIKDYRRQICYQLPAGFTMFSHIVHIRKMHFVFAPLKSFSKTKGKMEKIHAGEIIYKTTKPDLPDNLKKLVNDSMSGLVYADDSLIATENDVAKYYGTGGMIVIEIEGN